jgi:alanine racemase
MILDEVIVDLGAIRHNFLELKRLAGHKSGIIAVVKADAYGHGMIRVAKTIEREAPDYFGVFELEEALDLRKAGCQIPILIMMGITQDQVPAVVDEGFTVSLFQRDIAEALSNKALEQGRVVPVHVKVDSGMARLGVPWTEVADFLPSLLPLEGIGLEGVFTHLAVSDEPGNAFTEEQLARFFQVVQQCKDLGVCTDVVHTANSGGILGKNGLDFGLARPGISLYGSPPAEGLATATSLKPAMTFRSRVIQVKAVPAGTPISYGCTYTTEKPSTIATIPVGYDDGYSRQLSNKGMVLIHGQRVPIVGRVCMNLSMVDVTSLHDVSTGDEVVLLGVQGEERITAEEIAEKIGTISYEIYCSIGKSNRRTYLDPEKA